MYPWISGKGSFTQQVVFPQKDNKRASWAEKLPRRPFYAGDAARFPYAVGRVQVRNI